MTPSSPYITARYNIGLMKRSRPPESSAEFQRRKLCATSSHPQVVIARLQSKLLFKSYSGFQHLVVCIGLQVQRAQLGRHTIPLAIFAVGDGHEFYLRQLPSACGIPEDNILGSNVIVDAQRGWGRAPATAYRPGETRIALRSSISAQKT